MYVLIPRLPVPDRIMTVDGAIAGRRCPDIPHNADAGGGMCAAQAVLMRAGTVARSVCPAQAIPALFVAKTWLSKRLRCLWNVLHAF